MIYKWDDIKNDYPKQLKVSPIAAILHKSRLYRLSLDLSFQLKMVGNSTKSVNDTSQPTAPREALEQIGTALP